MSKQQVIETIMNACSNLTLTHQFKIYFMKNVTTITWTIIVLGLFTNISIVGFDSAAAALLVLLPSVILSLLTLFVKDRGNSPTSKIANLITTSVFSVVSALAYYEASGGNAHSSTDALIFLVLPIKSIVLIPVLYFVSKLILRFMAWAKQATFK